MQGVQEILRKVEVARKNPRRIVDGLSEPRPLARGGRISNVLGLQVARACADRLAWHMRASRVTPQVADAYRTLERDGVVIIRDYLSPADFAAVEREWRESEEAPDPNYRYFEFGDNFGTKQLTASDYPTRYPALMRTMRDNDFLLNLATAVSRRSRSFPPTVHIYTIHKPDPSKTHLETDPNQYLHADRHYPFIKAFFYMADIDADTAPYAYAKGSHVLNARRLRYEYDASVLYAKLAERRTRSRDRSRIPGDARDQPEAAISVEQERVHLAERLLKDLGTPLEPIVAPRNTLIVSNNIGFHSRSPLRSKGRRTTINVDFKYLESPAHRLYPVLRHVYGN